MEVLFDKIRPVLDLGYDFAEFDFYGVRKIILEDGSIYDPQVPFNSVILEKIKQLNLIYDIPNELDLEGGFKLLGSLEKIGLLHFGVTYTISEDYIELFPNFNILPDGGFNRQLNITITKNSPLYHQNFLSGNEDADMELFNFMDPEEIEKLAKVTRYSKNLVNKFFRHKFNMKYTGLGDVILKFSNESWNDLYNQFIRVPIEREIELRDIFTWAIRTKHSEVIPFIIENKVPLSMHHVRLSLEHDCIKCAHLIWSRVTPNEMIPSYGQHGPFSLMATRWTYAMNGNEFVDLKGLIDQAIYNGQLDILKWLKSIDQLIITTDASRYAMHSNGNLATVQWLDQNYDMKFDELIANEAARNGHVDILDWLYKKKGILPDGRAYRYAGNEEVIAWLLRHKISEFDEDWD